MRTTRNPSLSVGKSGLSSNHKQTKLSGSTPNKITWSQRILQLAIQLTPLVIILFVWELGTGAFGAGAPIPENYSLMYILLQKL